MKDANWNYSELSVTHEKQKIHLTIPTQLIQYFSFHANILCLKEVTFHAQDNLR